MTVEVVQERATEGAAFSVVVPVRDRFGPMLRNCLRGIELQTLQPIELIVADYGSSPENHEKLMQVLPDCTVYRCETEEPWSLAAARNIGLRRAQADNTCALDADLIMEPLVLETALEIHRAHPASYLTTRAILLDPAAIDPAAVELPRDYMKILTARSSYVSEGWGGFTSAPTWWWHQCQGFDERMKRWGWEDVDMWKRAARARMRRLRLSDDVIWHTAIYHQHHPIVQHEAYRLDDTELIGVIRQNERWAKGTGGVLRNDENWGNCGK